MSMIVAPSRFVAAGGGGISFRYYRWAITATKTPGDGTQASEFRLLVGGSPVAGTPTATLTNSTSAPGQDADKLVSGTLADKWYTSFAFGGNILFDFGSAVTADAYEWATANDSTGRDPDTWTVGGSNDNSTWTTLSTVTAANVTSSRDTWTGTQWPLSI